MFLDMMAGQPAGRPCRLYVDVPVSMLYYVLFKYLST